MNSNNLHPLFASILKQHTKLQSNWQEHSDCLHEIEGPADREYIRCTKCGEFVDPALL